jgi:RNA polymerase sigma factor (sigma-70 family)
MQPAGYSEGMEPLRSDEALMLAYRGGDAAAFEELYRRWRGRLFRYLVHQAGSPALAEELFQDIWLKVIGARGHYEVAAKFSTWLFRIAHNRLIDHWRGRGGKDVEILASYDDDEDDPPADQRMELAAPAHELPERLLERRDLAQHLAGAIAALPAAQRETFLMVEEGEMTLEEIAAVMGTGRETAKSRLRYALARLRQELKEWR